MAKQKVTVREGITTVDLQLSGQTVRLTVEEAQALARELASVANALKAKIWKQRALP